MKRITLILVMLLTCAAVGVGGMYLVLRPSGHVTAAPSSPSASPSSSPRPKPTFHYQCREELGDYKNYPDVCDYDVFHRPAQPGDLYTGPPYTPAPPPPSPSVLSHDDQLHTNWNKLSGLDQSETCVYMNWNGYEPFAQKVHDLLVKQGVGDPPSTSEFVTFFHSVCNENVKGGPWDYGAWGHIRNPLAELLGIQ